MSSVNKELQVVGANICCLHPSLHCPPPFNGNLIFPHACALLCSILFPLDVAWPHSLFWGGLWPARAAAYSVSPGAGMEERFPGLLGTWGRPLLTPWREVWVCEIGPGYSNFITIRGEVQLLGGHSEQLRMMPIPLRRETRKRKWVR